MLYEDTRMCCVFGHMAMANAIGPILASLDKVRPVAQLGGAARAAGRRACRVPEPCAAAPAADTCWRPYTCAAQDHPNVTLLGEFVKRIRASYSVLDIAGCVIDQAEKMGLSV